MPHRSPVTCVCNGLSAAVGFARNAKVEGPSRESLSIYIEGSPPHTMSSFISTCASLDAVHWTKMKHDSIHLFSFPTLFF